MFKEFLKEKRMNLMEAYKSDDFKDLYLKYSESDTIDETLKYYMKEKGMDVRKVNNILQDNSLVYDDFSLNDHEDLLDAGYILGHVQAKMGGKIIGVLFDKKRYYFIGNESEIVHALRQKLNNELIAK